MTQFRFNIGDVVEYINETNKLWLGTRHRVINRRLNEYGQPQIKVDFIDGKPTMAAGLWHMEGLFRLINEAVPPAHPKPEGLTGRARARELLSEAETKRGMGEGYRQVQPLALLGILHAILEDEPQSRRIEELRQDSTVAELRQDRDRIHGQLDDSWKERDQLKEKVDILEAELAVAKNHEHSARAENQDLRVAVSGLKADKREALEEVARLNRKHGIVPTRQEAVAEVKGFTVTENGNTVEISDGDDDVIRFERPLDCSDSFIFVAPICEDENGVYVTRAQWDALTRKAEAWAQDREDG